jgi:phage tail protein X
MPLTETLVVQHDATTLDLLLWRRFQRAYIGLVERTLDINPGLAEFGPILPVGTRVLIEVPAPTAVVPLPVVSLWD